MQNIYRNYKVDIWQAWVTRGRARTSRGYKRTDWITVCILSKLKIININIKTLTCL